MEEDTCKMTSEDTTHLELHVDEMAERNLRRTIVKNSCPYYTGGTVCGGTVIFEQHESIGTCQSCGREIPIIVQM